MLTVVGLTGVRICALEINSLMKLARRDVVIRTRVHRFQHLVFLTLSGE